MTYTSKSITVVAYILAVPLVMVGFFVALGCGITYLIQDQWKAFRGNEKKEVNNPTAHGRKPSARHGGQHATIATTACLVAVLCGGCVAKNAINSQTSTVFGIQLDQNQNGVPSIKLGLIRSEWHVVPVGSNGTPSVLAVTDAELRPFGSDKVHKVYATGEAVKAPATTNWFPTGGTNAP